MIRTNAYMFRHRTAIFREWSEVHPENGSPVTKHVGVCIYHELRFMIYTLQ